MSIAQPPTLFAEIIDFLTSTATPEQIVAFKPSETLEQRLTYLLEQERQTDLTDDEQHELDEFLRMNHFMNMLKIRARQKLAK
jgi:hypothetical protein